MVSKNFIFGTATASFQIEGASEADGKLKSIWDAFCEKEGKIIDRSNGKTACMSYYKYKDDVRLLKELGVQAYRFSIAWSRVMNKDFSLNAKGMEYYKNLCKELLDNGIEPYVTLYHWDMPQFLDDMGGFLNAECPEWFYRYADLVTSGLSGLARHYITINEPQCILNLGHRVGEHAPDIKYDNKEMLLAVHNLLKAHGKMCIAIRKNVKDATIGFAPCSTAVIPNREGDKKLEEACYNKFFEMGDDYAYPGLVSVYSDPVFLGDYPKEYYERFKDIMPQITKEDLKLINQPIDFCYQNVYTGDYWDFDKDGKLTILQRGENAPMADICWLHIAPKSLYYIPKFLHKRYNHPVIISENGACFNDVISPDGKIHDEKRTAFIREYFANLERAEKEADVRGYFYWSLMDNFEWAYGYTKRFGLAYTDYNTYERIPKDSFYEYQRLIKNSK